jgi:hypothetical protein
MTLTMLLAIIVFMVGIYFYARCADPKYVEEFTNTNHKQKCPNLLIQKGSRFYLYNSKIAQVPGVNPIEFDNLEDYTEFLDWQRSQGIRCPVLYLQSSYDAQGNRVYKARPSVTEPQSGLPPSAAAPMGIASSSGDIIMESSLGNPNALAYPNPTLLVDATRNDAPYNNNSYPGYDQSSHYVGTTTPLDMMDVQQEKAVISPNPMDPNWGGSTYTQSLIDKGYYKEDEVSIQIP